jgi:hypothetical protein
MGMRTTPHPTRRSARGIDVRARLERCRVELSKTHTGLDRGGTPATAAYMHSQIFFGKFITCAYCLPLSALSVLVETQSDRHCPSATRFTGRFWDANPAVPGPL